MVQSYGLTSLQLGRPVIEAVGNARPNVEVFGELATRLGLRTETATSDVEALLELTTTLPENAQRDLMDQGIANGVDKRFFHEFFMGFHVIKVVADKISS